MKYKVFYAWQSDLPNKDNRSFIQSSLDKALKFYANMGATDIVIPDRDTKGISGTPDIANTILSKIDGSDIFVCDITSVNMNEQDTEKTDRHGSSSMNIPNPNVMFELGYASKAIGWNNIICILNKKYCSYENVPFDIRNRRILAYDSSEEKGKQKLVNSLVAAIECIHKSGLMAKPYRVFNQHKITKSLSGVLYQIWLMCISRESINEKEKTNEVDYLLSLNYEAIRKILLHRQEIMGIYAKNNLAYIQEELYGVLPVITQNDVFPNEWTNIVLRLIDWHKKYLRLIGPNSPNKYYMSSADYSGRLDVNHSIITFAGKTIHKYLLFEKVSNRLLYQMTTDDEDIEHLCSSYRMNLDSIELYTDCFDEIIKISREWLAVIQENNNIFKRES